MQQRCSKLVIDANFEDNSFKVFTQLGRLPIDDVIYSRRPYLIHNIVSGDCPDYFTPNLSVRNILSHKQFLLKLQEMISDLNVFLEHFEINITF